MNKVDTQASDNNFIEEERREQLETTFKQSHNGEKSSTIEQAEGSNVSLVIERSKEIVEQPTNTYPKASTDGIGISLFIRLQKLLTGIRQAQSRPQQTVNTVASIASSEIVSSTSSLEKKSNSAGVSHHSDAITIYLDQAQIYCNQQQWKKSIGVCQEILKTHPENVSALKMWGDILQKMGHGADSMGYYAKALQIQPNSPEVHANLATLYAKRKKWNRAAEHYQKAIEVNPSFAGAYRNLAKVYKQLGKHQEMNQCLVRAMLLKPELGTVEELCKVGHTLTEGSVDEAVKCYKAAIKLEPNCLEAYQALGNIYDNQGEWQKAVNCYRRVLDLKEARAIEHGNKGLPSQTVRKHSLPKLNDLRKLTSSENIESKSISNKTIIDSQQENRDVEKSLLQRTKLQVSSEKVKKTQIEAATVKKYSTSGIKKNNTAASAKNTIKGEKERIKILLEREKERPEEVSIQLELGHHYLEQQEWERARIHFEKALKLNHVSAALYRNLAKVLNNLGKREEAAEYWYRSFQLDPEWASAMHHTILGEELLNQKKTDKAEVCFIKAIETDSKFKEAYEKLGYLYEKQGTINKQINTYEKFNGEVPEDSQAKIKLAKLLVGQKRYPEAEKILLKAIELAPDDWEAYHILGNTLTEQKKWSEAEKYLYRAIELNKMYSWSYSSIGEVLIRLDRQEDAIKYLCKAIELKPDFCWSHYNLGDAYSDLEMWGKALACYQRANEIEPDLPQIEEKLGYAILWTEENPEKALELYKKEITKKPENESNYYKALEIEPYNLGLYIELGNLFEVRQEYEKAIAYYQLALEIEPSRTDIIAKLQKIESNKIEKLNPV
ncbi:MAG: tetratricopeptide repeat protein [Synechococcus sp.]